MALFYLSSHVHTPINSQHVESFNLNVHNLDGREFDLLVQASHPDRMLLLELRRMHGSGQSGSIYAATNIITGFQPFTLQIATNIRNRSTLGINLELLQGGIVVARVTHDHAELTQLE